MDMHQMKQDLVWDSYWGSADPASVRAIEAELGKRYPSAYVEIVSRYNGAFAERDPGYRIYCNGRQQFETFDLGLFHAFGQCDEITETVRWCLDHKPYGLPGHLVTFSQDGGGNYLCFDYSKAPDGDDPEIVRWDTNFEPGTGEEVSFVAKNFAALLDMLFVEEDD